YADWEEDPELKENEFDIGITVANNYQRKGLGTELMKYIIKRGKHLGLEKACLWTRQDNKGMKKLAHKLRFLENGEKQKNGFKWIRFVKELSQNKKEKNEKKQMDSSILLQYQ
ncbi:MAG: GNAT family N-acetyltransferase, partial [Asgard group archaeon]|nr:GNAT family N-acetyltransferase [Asgard group archaeon]